METGSTGPLLELSGGRPGWVIHAEGSDGCLLSGGSDILQDHQAVDLGCLGRENQPQVS